ncbi:hypothetical protein [Rubripirellula reticaptiva]|uniref:Uncharacterized protein n=1 Tax=Rubripirellula reticaptiva TaxID=2528013 RepID=A0A5C6EKH2_9BACT|nr:hypothetical protein [Rubripirellula reticaptiva]TWU47809.1 hypothetical protein Poly59_46510 [Rubripirellula reticaptiva]
MNKHFVAALAVVAASLLGSSVLQSGTASAQGFGEFGFAPYGFYQPFGARYSTSIRTPPYFATNPPVYYGARHARPYGLSPFASPPMVQAGPNYNSRLRTEFAEPIVPTPSPSFSQPCGNPCVHHSGAKPNPAKLGAIQSNPFVDSTDRIASAQKTEA